MKYFIPLFALLFLVACQRDEDALNDQHLFGRLQARNGTWKVEKYEINDNTLQDPEITITEPENDFFHFYILSSMAFNTLIDISTVDVYINDTLVQSNKIAAERERVIFEGLNPGTGTVWTVEHNKPNTQIWVKTEGDETMRIYLKRCNCAIPNYNKESEG